MYQDEDHFFGIHLCGNSYPIYTPSSRHMAPEEKDLIDSYINPISDDEKRPIDQLFSSHVCLKRPEEDGSKKQISASTLEHQANSAVTDQRQMMNESQEQSPFILQKSLKGKEKKTTKIDNHKNYTVTTIKAIKRQLETCKVANFLLARECQKRDVPVKKVKQLIGELAKGHLSLAKLRKHVSPTRGDCNFAVRDAFGAYFDLFMERSFQSYVWSSSIVQKIRCVQFGLRCLSYLRKGASQLLRSQTTP